VDRGQPSPDIESLARDEDGHGTRVLSVLMRVAPAADVYVARIAKDARNLAACAENIAEVRSYRHSKYLTSWLRLTFIPGNPLGG
jgi:hypothetical protein